MLCRHPGHGFRGWGLGLEVSNSSSVRLRVLKTYCDGVHELKVQIHLGSKILSPKPKSVMFGHRIHGWNSGGQVWAPNPGVLLNGQGDLVSRSRTPITHNITLRITIMYLLTKSP